MLIPLLAQARSDPKTVGSAHGTQDIEVLGLASVSARNYLHRKGRRRPASNPHPGQVTEALSYLADAAAARASDEPALASLPSLLGLRGRDLVGRRCRTAILEMCRARAAARPAVCPVSVPVAECPVSMSAPTAVLGSVVPAHPEGLAASGTLTGQRAEPRSSRPCLAAVGRPARPPESPLTTLLTNRRLVDGGLVRAFRRR